MLVLTVVYCLLATAASGVLADHEFVNNRPDSRCKKRGEFLTHPKDRCKYVVCEFGTGTAGYLKEKMYARVMGCAPGTAVPFSQYQRGVHTIHGVPCTEHYSGRCPASLGGKYVLHPSSSYGRFTHNSRYSPAKSVYPRQRQQRRNYYQGRPSSGFNYRRNSHKTPSVSYPRYSSTHHNPKPDSVSNKHDGRCKKVGQFLTHPTNRCRYVVCEYERNTLTTAVVHDTTRMYARVMQCAPGTAVPHAKYTSSSTISSTPCTEFYSGHCPAPPSAYHPLGHSRSTLRKTSRRSRSYRYY